MNSKTDDEKKSAEILSLAAWNLPGWMEQFDAVEMAPEFHKVVFENDTIRMLSITINPGEEEQMHTHKWKSVLWFKNYSPSVYTEFSLSSNNR